MVLKMPLNVGDLSMRQSPKILPERAIKKSVILLGHQQLGAALKLYSCVQKNGRKQLVGNDKYVPDQLPDTTVYDDFIPEKGITRKGMYTVLTIPIFCCCIFEFYF